MPTKSMSPDDVVISGIAGSYPDCDNIEELAEKLYAKIDLVTENGNWKELYPDVPTRYGKLKNWNKFDADYFGLNSLVASSMNPMSRKLLEKIFEATLDAGINPKLLRKSNTGVYVGVCSFSDLMKFEGDCPAYMMQAQFTFANNVSYYYDLKGPSCTTDTACSSSLTAMDAAYKAIKSGVCDAAFVAGINIILEATTSRAFASGNLISLDGKCKSFDESANGFARSEIVCVTLLQKSKDAKRIYAKVLNTFVNNDGFKIEGPWHPSSAAQTKLLSKLYDECCIDPSQVKWVESHGTGTQAGDFEEITSLDLALCKNRSTPLMVSSIKSSAGHAEGGSGQMSVSKVIIAMERGVIPPNIHLNRVNPVLQPVIEGRIKIVTEPEPWDGGMVGINSFGIGGANCHVLLESYEDKPKINNGLPSDELPRLVVLSGRTEESVDYMISKLSTNPMDVEQIQLLQDMQELDIAGHLYRGYVLLKKNLEVCSKDVQRYSEEKRPVWFVFSGVGSQWPAMARTLMVLPKFAECIEKSHQLLIARGFDLKKVLTDDDPNLLADVFNALIAITAFQVALVDVLKSIGIEPDGIVGHSAGEVVCGYADGCLTLEEVILVAFERGLTSNEFEECRGSMAAIGMSYKDVESILPAGVEVGCHNSPTNCTITGNTEAVNGLVTELSQKGVFARKINSFNTAFHCTRMRVIIPSLLRLLRNVIKNPKKRSSRWLSTSVPEDKLGDYEAQYCSAEYYTNNMTNIVLFEEACRKIPPNAITIEIGPHGILQTILKLSLDKSVLNFSLTNRTHPNNLECLLGVLGRLHEIGVNQNISKLYPMVQYPVSRGTPMISPLIKWEHSKDWAVRFQKLNCDGIREVKISLQDEKYKFLTGHILDGRVVFPATGYMVLAWETFALMRGKLHQNYSVVLENLKFSEITFIPEIGEVIFMINVHRTTGLFQITRGDIICCKGVIREHEESDNINTNNGDEDDKPIIGDLQDLMDLNQEDCYKEMRLRGYQHKNEFQGLRKSNNIGTRGILGWSENYCIFLDWMLHLWLIHYDVRSLKLPEFIGKVVLDVNKHKQVLKLAKDTNQGIEVKFNPNFQEIISGGVRIVEIRTIKTNKRNIGENLVLRKQKFIPFTNRNFCGTIEAIQYCCTIIIEKVKATNCKILEILKDKNVGDDVIVCKILQDHFKQFPGYQAEVAVFSDLDEDLLKDISDSISVVKVLPKEKQALVVCHNAVNSKENLTNTMNVLMDNGFILCIENTNCAIDLDALPLDCVFDSQTDDYRILLLRKNTRSENKQTVVIKVELSDYSWIKKLQETIKKVENQKDIEVLIYSEKEPINGILGFYKSIKREVGNLNIRCFFIIDKDAPSFSLEDEFYKRQLELDYDTNVYKDGAWGVYCLVPLEEVTKVKSKHAFVTTTKYSDLSALSWLQGPINPYRYTPELLGKKKTFQVHYSSLNFRDVMLATGALNTDIFTSSRFSEEGFLGCEYSGCSPEGERYMGLSHHCISTHVVTNEVLTWKVPDHWSLEDAATVPMIYATVIDALIIHGNLQKGESILIHAATGGVGQAAIHMALHFGCKIFVTVGTEEKLQFIQNQFPQIPRSRIGNSRDTGFERMIMKETNGKGVDIVLNSLSGEFLQASFRCLAMYGRFLEIGKADFVQDSTLGMNSFLTGISFHGITIDSFLNIDSWEKTRVFVEMQKALDEGYVKPIARKVFQRDQVQQAFRFMASGKHIGKVLIKIRDENDSDLLIDAIPRYLCFSARSYIICGGLGGMGLELTDWLILRGARNIVLTSRAGIKTGYQSLRVRIWRSYGVNLIIFKEDTTSEEGVRNLIKASNDLAPVYAIFNLAAVTRDALFEHQTEDAFAEVTKPKMLTTLHLDRLSREMCPRLEKFVVFSSTSSSLGNLGQTNYAWANSMLERICEQRRHDNLPALVMQWGPVADVGLFSNMTGGDNTIQTGGISQQSISSCLECLDTFLNQPHTIVLSMIVSGKESLSSQSKSLSLTDAILRVLDMKDLKNVSLNMTLSERGIDSLMTSSLKQMLEMDYGLSLNTNEIRNLTFGEIQRISKELAKGSAGNVTTGEKP